MTDMTPERELAAARAALASADAASHRARAQRQAAQARVNLVHSAAAARQEEQRREQWADPALAAALADARAIEAAARAELDTLTANLRAEHARRLGREGKSTNAGVFDLLGTLVAEDPRHVAAVETVEQAKGMRLQAQRAYSRNAAQREYETHTAQRDQAREAARPDAAMRGRLAGLRDRLPGVPRRLNRAGLDRSLSVTDEAP